MLLPKLALLTIWTCLFSFVKAETYTCDGWSYTEASESMKLLMQHTFPTLQIACFILQARHHGRGLAAMALGNPLSTLTLMTRYMWMIGIPSFWSDGTNILGTCRWQTRGTWPFLSRPREIANHSLWYLTYLATYFKSSYFLLKVTKGGLKGMYEFSHMTLHVGRETDWHHHRCGSCHKINNVCNYLSFLYSFRRLVPFIL